MKIENPKYLKNQSRLSRENVAYVPLYYFYGLSGVAVCLRGGSRNVIRVGLGKMFLRVPD